MAFLTTQFRAILILAAQCLLVQVVLGQCNTDQNPYCRGNKQFEQLCCTYPDVCYWADRSGTPACCPAGTDCSSNGGPSWAGPVSEVQATTVQTTYLVETMYTTTQPQYQTVTYYSSSQWQSWQQSTTTYVPAPVYTSFSTCVSSAVVVVTATTAVVSPVQSNGVFVTVQAVGNGAAKLGGSEQSLSKVLGAFAFACAVGLQV